MRGCSGTGWRGCQQPGASSSAKLSLIVQSLVQAAQGTFAAMFPSWMRLLAALSQVQVSSSVRATAAQCVELQRLSVLSHSGSVC